MVLALREGATYSDVAAMLGRTRCAIAGCLRRYTERKKALPVDEAGEGGVTLLGLKEGRCKWPVRAAPGVIGGHYFCAARVEFMGASYCAPHRQVAIAQRKVA